MDKSAAVGPPSLMIAAAVEIRAAFLASRRDFDRWGTIEEEASVASSAQQALLARRARVMPYHGDTVEALHLLGALGAVCGGGADKLPDRVGSMFTSFAVLASIATAWKLSVGPLLVVADAMASMVPTPTDAALDAVVYEMMIAATPDLVIAVTAPRDPARSAATVEDERAAVFCALGIIATSLVVFARSSMADDLTAVELFAEAAEVAWS